MQESFFKSSNINPSELRMLMKKRDTPGLIRFTSLLVFALIASFAIVLTWQETVWAMALAHLGFGIVCCNAFACLHESAHGTAFKSAPLGKFVAFIAGILHVYPSSLFRSLHFAHHRHTHVPGLDPEISLGNSPAPPLLGHLPIYLAWMSGLPLLFFKLFMMITCVLGLPEFFRKSFFPFIQPSKRMIVGLESALNLSAYALVLWMALYVHVGFWGIFTGQILGHCILATYLIMEHNGLPHDGHILEKTRSINTNWFVKWVMWNMPYHAEHHAYPAIPFHALPELHIAIEHELIHKEEGVGEFHLKLLKEGFQ